MAQEDIIEASPEEVQRVLDDNAAVEEFDAERERALKAHKEAVAQAKEDIRKHLDADKLEPGASTKLREEFDKIQKTLRERFSSRLNTAEEDKQIQALIAGTRFTERFELSQKGFWITFRNVNSEETAFIAGFTLRNPRELQDNPEAIPKYREEWRQDMLLAFSTVAINDHVFEPPDLESVHDSLKNCEKPNDRMNIINKFVDSVTDRANEIKRKLPYGLFGVASSALTVWLEYQRNLVSPEKLENF